MGAPMYPAQLFNLFPPFPRDERVFVAMSFDTRFDARWRNVIAPAIRSLQINGRAMEPVRVDTRRVGDSILTEILTGISKNRLVFADITTLGLLDGQPVRNANVLYEIGLAHAVRLPEEVIIFRSDRDRLLFDVSTIRVNTYSPDEDPVAARNLLATTLLEAVREVDLRRNLAAQQSAEMLDHTMYLVLSQTATNGSLEHPAQRTMGDFVGKAPTISAINRLLELGLLCSKAVQMTPELMAEIGDRSDFSLLRYECTALGRTVMRIITDRVVAPEMRETIRARIAEMRAAADSGRENSHVTPNVTPDPGAS